MGENICKSCIWSKINVQNMWGTHIIQQENGKEGKKERREGDRGKEREGRGGKRALLKSKQRIWKDIFLKKTYKWPTGVWKNVQCP